MILLHRITAYLLLIAAIIISFFLINPVEKQASDSPDIDSPSPALGRAVATGIHQVVTDPYLVPIENLSEYLAANPDRQEISVDLLTKWASDLQFPTCFVWDAVRGGMQIDHPSSPWAMEAIVEQLDEGLITDNPRGQLFISVFKVEGEKYWLGYLPVPGGFSRVRQMAGVFFSIDKYLERDVPRLIDEMVSRSRFPLVPFQRDMEPIYGENDGHISAGGGHIKPGTVNLGTHQQNAVSQSAANIGICCRDPV